MTRDLDPGPEALTVDYAVSRATRFPRLHSADPKTPPIPPDPSATVDRAPVACTTVEEAERGAGMAGV